MINLIKSPHSRGKLFDLIILLGIIYVSTLLILEWQVKPLISTIFYFVIPAVYLFVREKKNSLKIIWSSIVVGLVFGFIVDLIATYNYAWVVDQLVFQSKVLGIVNIDNLIWFLCLAFFINTFYEHFIDDELDKKMSTNFLLGAVGMVTILVLTIVAYVIIPEILILPYAYMTLGCIFSIPMIYLLLTRPRFITKFFKLACFFFILFLVFELTALTLGQWSFPGQYVGMVEIMNLSFPFEEFFFWIILGSPLFVSYYELIIDDGK